MDETNSVDEQFTAYNGKKSYSQRKTNNGMECEDLRVEPQTRIFLIKTKNRAELKNVEYQRKL